MGEAKRRKAYIEAWCGRMAARYGALLTDNHGQDRSWRAALYREAHGLLGEPPEKPTGLELEVAKAWEAGFWPKWAPPPGLILALPGDG